MLYGDLTKIMNLSKNDLKIKLSPSQISQSHAWLENFYSKCKSRMSDPVIEDGFLKISSADIYNFLDQAALISPDQLDWYRLKKSSEKLLSDLSERKKTHLVKSHYLAMRKIIKDL